MKDNNLNSCFSLNTVIHKSACPFGFMIAAFMMVPGCTSKKNGDTDFGFANDQLIVQSQNNISLAMGFVDQLGQLDLEQASERILSHLNRWIENREPDPDWFDDPLIKRLPETYRDLIPYQQIAKRSFVIDDVEFLQEAIWFRDVANWVSNRSQEDYSLLKIEPLSSSSQESQQNNLNQNGTSLHQGLSPDEAADLTTVLRLFDWTIRNTQLEELLSYPHDLSGPVLPQNDPAKIQKPLPPPMRAIPGPGYTRQPWQTLLHGSGDAWQRARVFIHLARQQGIDVVMLAVNDGDPANPRPWLPAAMIGSHIYLFDTTLGLPIPGPNAKGIATLQQATEDPSLLRSLDVVSPDGTQLNYPVSASDLEKKIVVLIDASPSYLSQRMKMLEKEFTEGDKVVLTTSPSELAAKLRKHPTVEFVRLWSVPAEALLYQFVKIMKFRQPNPSKLDNQQEYLEFWFDEALFSPMGPIANGRRQHFRGIFQPQLKSDSAKTWYLEARVSDEMIQRYAEDQKLQLHSSLAANLPKDIAAKQAILDNSVKFFTTTKQSAGYWLALAHFDSGDYASAVNWLKRTMKSGPEGKWDAGAHYNLARAYEALGQQSKARELLLQDKSLQRHGNLVRAQWLADNLQDSVKDNSQTQTDW